MSVGVTKGFRIVVVGIIFSRSFFGRLQQIVSFEGLVQPSGTGLEGGVVSQFGGPFAALFLHDFPGTGRIGTGTGGDVGDQSLFNVFVLPTLAALLMTVLQCPGMEAFQIAREGHDVRLLVSTDGRDDGLLFEELTLTQFAAFEFVGWFVALHGGVFFHLQFHFLFALQLGVFQAQLVPVRLGMSDMFAAFGGPALAAFLGL